MSAEYCVEKFVTPRGNVQWSGLEDHQRQQELFQLKTMARTATVARAGRDIGSSTRQKNPNWPQPSMRGRVLQLDRDRPEERPQDDDRQRQPERRLRQGDAERVVEKAQLPDQDEQRQDRDRDREQQAEHEQREQRLAPAERHAGEHERRERRRRPRRARSRSSRPGRCCRAQPEGARRRGSRCSSDGNQESGRPTGRSAARPLSGTRRAPRTRSA